MTKKEILKRLQHIDICLDDVFQNPEDNIWWFLEEISKQIKEIV